MDLYPFGRYKIFAFQLSYFTNLFTLFVAVSQVVIVCIHLLVKFPSFEYLSFLILSGGDNETSENGETCVQSKSQQKQCWVLGGAHYYTFDGQVFEFQGNCTYTLIHLLNDTSESNTFWVRVEKDRTPHETSSVKAIHVKVAEDKITVFRGDRGSVWVRLSHPCFTVSIWCNLNRFFQSSLKFNNNMHF